MSTTWVDTMAVGGAAIENADSASGQAPAHAAAQGSLKHVETGEKSDAVAWARDQQQELADDERCGAWLDGDAKRPAPAKPRGAFRSVAALSAAGKPQNMCMYELCPSPMHSNKWRTVTSTTGAGGRDWSALCGKTLCDSCYSTYRKHGTFVRSVRTDEGWVRSSDGQVLAKSCDASRDRSAQRAPPAPSRAAKRACVVAATAPAGGPHQSRDSAGRPKRERRPSSKLRAADAEPKAKIERTFAMTAAHADMECQFARDYLGASVFARSITPAHLACFDVYAQPPPLPAPTELCHSYSHAFQMEEPALFAAQEPGLDLQAPHAVSSPGSFCSLSTEDGGQDFDCIDAGVNEMRHFNEMDFLAPIF